jgi:hypothetical protein
LARALEQAMTGATPARRPPETAASAATGVAAELDTLARAPVDADLATLATQQEPGPVPLLGTPNTTTPYAALLWNGGRFERLDVSWATRLAFVAVTARGAPAFGESLVPAVEAGVALRALWPPPAAPGAVAALTADAVSAAVCAAVATDHADADLAAVAELASGLMVVGPTVSDPRLRTLQAGHSLAAGWLAVQLHLCDLLAAPGTAEEVLLTRAAP